MYKLKKFMLAGSVFAALLFSSCLHIVEEATFHNNGSGTYKMTMDMSELKGMMDMVKNMGGNQAEPGKDSTNISDGGDYTPPAAAMPGAENPMNGLGDQISGVATSLKDLPGITNVVEVNDTASFSFGYSFDFADVNALNRALKIINKDKFDSKTEETFKFDGKSFERLGAGDIGSEMKKVMGDQAADSGDDNASQMDMMKMFFADMSYKQIYHFPDRKVKKSSNKLSQVEDDGHTISLIIKPFSEDQQKEKVSVATKVKLK